MGAFCALFLWEKKIHFTLFFYFFFLLLLKQEMDTFEKGFFCLFVFPYILNFHLMKKSLNKNGENIMKSQNHRMVWLRRDFKDHLVPTFLL